MAVADDSKLHWCTEEIPTGANYFLEFEQSFTEPQFLGSLRREPSWIGSLPLIRTDVFDLQRLKYLVPTPATVEISTSDPAQIHAQLSEFSEHLLQPAHAFVYVFTNFDVCDPSDFIPTQAFHSQCKQCLSSLPLFIGNAINPQLVTQISALLRHDGSLPSLSICEDMSRTGVGFRCLYPARSMTAQCKFVVRATVEYQYPSDYTIPEHGLQMMPLDATWMEYVDRVQTGLVQPQHMATQQEKLWLPLLVDADTTASNASDDDDDDDTTAYPRVRVVSATDEKHASSKKLNLYSPFVFYDFAQTRYSSVEHNLDALVDTLTSTATEALKCGNMQRPCTSKIAKAHVFMVLSTDEHAADAPAAVVYRLNILQETDLNTFFSRHASPHDNHSHNKTTSLGTLLVDIIGRNLDEFHKEMLLSAHCTAVHFMEMVEKLFEFLQPTQDVKKQRTNLLLLQERAIIVLADVLWWFYKRFHAQFVRWLQTSTQPLQQLVARYVSHKPENIHQLCHQLEALQHSPPTLLDCSDDTEMHRYYTFLEPFLKAANEKELQDFNECAQQLLRRHSNVYALRFTQLRYVDTDVAYCTRSGMRVGISSANASDNWTNSKLSGGVTINMSINLHSIQTAPVTAKVEVIPDKVLIRLSTTHTMHGDVTEDVVQFDAGNVDEFLHIDDNKDVFRMLKYALIFVGIVKDPNTNVASSSSSSPSQSTSPQYESILSDIAAFTNGHGLALSVANLGPSRSGFASSSAVACNLLKVLYACTGSAIATDDELLGSMALLLENRLGLKSGRQDVDGLLPNGIKILAYPRTTGFVAPHITFLTDARNRFQFDIASLNENLILVNSGIARAAGLGLHRGLNMRFLAYLSRDPVRFKSILQSYQIHALIVKALQCNNYCLLGKLFLDYMSCRERIDPGATQSKYDQHFHHDKVLRQLFDPLVHEQKVIYGGMFTGAMGGGVAMLVVTPFGKQPSDQDPKLSNLEYELSRLKQWKLSSNAMQPFDRLSVIKYSVNLDGILLQKHEKHTAPTEWNLVQKEYLFESMSHDCIACLDENFEKITLSLDGVGSKEIQQIQNIANKGKIEKRDVHIVVLESCNANDTIAKQKICHAVIS